jgi:hypothetical protein
MLEWFPPYPPVSRDHQAEKSTDEQGDGSPIETWQPAKQQISQRDIPVEEEQSHAHDAPAQVVRSDRLERGNGKLSKGGAKSADTVSLDLLSSSNTMSDAARSVAHPLDGEGGMRP